MQKVTRERAGASAIVPRVVAELVSARERFSARVNASARLAEKARLACVFIARDLYVCALIVYARGAAYSLRARVVCDGSRAGMRVSVETRREFRGEFKFGFASAALLP